MRPTETGYVRTEACALVSCFFDFGARLGLDDLLHRHHS